MDSSAAKRDGLHALQSAKDTAEGFVAEHSRGDEAADHDEEKADKGEVVEDTKLSLDNLLDKDQKGLAAFVADSVKEREERREARREELAVSASKMLDELAQEVKGSEDEKLHKDFDALEIHDGDDLVNEIYSIIDDEAEDLEDRVKAVDELLEHYRKLVAHKLERKAKLQALIEQGNNGKKTIIASIMTLPGFAALPALMRQQIKDLETDDSLTNEDFADEASHIIAEHTGKEVDVKRLMLVEQFGGFDPAAHGDEELSMIDHITRGIHAMEGNANVAALEKMAEVLEIPLTIVSEIGMATIGSLQNTIKGLEDLDVYDNVEDPDRAEAAAMRLEYFRKIAEWIEDNSDQCHDRLCEAVDESEIAAEDPDTAEQIKLKVQPWNLTLVQLAFVMFGDGELIRDALMKGPSFAKRSYKFARRVLGQFGGDAKTGRAVYGHLLSPNKELSGLRDSLRDTLKDIGKNAHLPSSKLDGLMEAEKAFDKFDKQVDGLKFSSDHQVSVNDLRKRDALRKSFDAARKTMEKRFAALGAVVHEEAKLYDRLMKASLNGKTVGDLRLGNYANIFERYAGGVDYRRMDAMDMFKKVKDGLTSQMAALSHAQEALNKRVAQSVEKVTAKMSKVDGVIESLRDVNKASVASQKVLREVEKNTSLTGALKHHGARWGLPIFAVGGSVYRGISQNQGLAKTGAMVAEAGISFIPFVGSGMDIYLAFKGTDLAGNDLNGLERFAYGAFGTIGLVADAFGAYPVRVALGTLVKGHRGVKAVRAVGKSRSILGKSIQGVARGARKLSQEGRFGAVYDLAVVQKVRQYRRLEEAQASGRALSSADKSLMKRLGKALKRDHSEVLDAHKAIVMSKYQKTYRSGMGIMKGMKSVVRDGVAWSWVKGVNVLKRGQKVIRKGDDVYLRVKGGVLKARFAEAKKAYASFEKMEDANRIHLRRIKNMDKVIAKRQDEIDKLRKIENPSVAEKARLSRLERRVDRIKKSQENLNMKNFKQMTLDRQLSLIREGAEGALTGWRKHLDTAAYIMQKPLMYGGAAAGLSYMITLGNVGPKELASGTSSAVGFAGSAVSKTADFLGGRDKPVTAADEMIAGIVAESKMRRDATEQIWEENGIAGEMEGLASHMDSEMGQAIAARSGMAGYEISEYASGDSGWKTFEA